MEFLKRHLFLLVCGFVGTLGITLAVFGSLSMGAVREEMQKSIRLVTELEGMSRRPSGSDSVINSKSIGHQRERIEAIDRNHHDILERAHALCDWKPLVTGAFPKPDIKAKQNFQDAYAGVFRDMMHQLHAGSAPTQAQIDEAKAQIELEKDITITGDAGDGAMKKDEGLAFTTGGVPLERAARHSPPILASIANARNIYCYATLDPPERCSFDIHPSIKQQITALNVNDMWDAQVALWIQQDVVDALVRVNAAAAKRLEDAGQEPWVGVLPVKELISIRCPIVSPLYTTAEDLGNTPAAPGGPQPALPSAGGGTVFTNHSSNATYEVVQFTLKMIVDVRDLPAIIGEICDNRFHTVLRVAYVVDPPNLDLVGKIYGPEPVVNVVIDFETHMFGDIFRPMMPDDVRTFLKLPVAGQDKQKT